MKNKFKIVMSICILVLIGIGVVVGSYLLHKGNLNQVVGSSLLPSSFYEVHFTVDNEYIHLFIQNKTNKEIHVARMVIKNENIILEDYGEEFSLKLNVDNRISFENKWRIDSSLNLEVLLYDSKEDLVAPKEESLIYTCSKDTNFSEVYVSSFFYTFKYSSGLVYATRVYQELKFKEEDTYEDFTFYTVPDGMESYELISMEEDKENLIKRYIFQIDYPMPPLVNTEDEYIQYLKDKFNFNCTRVMEE